MIFVMFCFSLMDNGYQVKFESAPSFMIGCVAFMLIRYGLCTSCVALCQYMVNIFDILS